MVDARDEAAHHAGAAIQAMFDEPGWGSKASDLDVITTFYRSLELELPGDDEQDMLASALYEIRCIGHWEDTCTSMAHVIMGLIDGLMGYTIWRVPVKA